MIQVEMFTLVSPQVFFLQLCTPFPVLFKELLEALLCTHFT